MDQINRNQNNLRTDECFMNQQNKENKSIFSYMTNNNMFINTTECLDTTPGFLNYIPHGTPTQNIDVENDLRGAIRNNSKCTTQKWTSPTPELATEMSTETIDYFPNNKDICEPKERILPKGYYMDPKTMKFVLK